MIAGLAGAEHAKHPHVACGLVAAGVGMDAIQRPVAAVTGQLAYPSMLADRIAARALTQPLDRRPNCRQTAPRPWP